MLKIWELFSAVNVQKAMWAVGETGQPYERIDLGGRFGGLDNPGSRQEVVDKVGFLLDQSKCDRFIYQGDYGGQPWSKVMRSLEMYAADVMPDFK